MLAVGDRVEVKHHRGKLILPAMVLATLKGLALLEYTSPGGFNALVFCDVHDDHEGLVRHCHRNAYGYKKLPVAWLRALVQGIPWQGYTRAGQVPDAAEILSERLLGRQGACGWVRRGDTWSKTYKGHYLRIERRLSFHFAYVGTWQVGKYAKRKGNNGSWRRAAFRAQHVVDSFGPAIKPRGIS